MSDAKSGTLATAAELARILNVPVSWVYQHTADRSIPCIRVGRYVRFDVQQVVGWLRSEQRAARAARAL